jgi:hypothetical protein
MRAGMRMMVWGIGLAAGCGVIRVARLGANRYLSAAAGPLVADPVPHRSAPFRELFFR